MPKYKSIRSPTYLQYEENFKMLYRDIRDRMLRIPKRRRKLVAGPVMHVMNRAYRHMTDIDNLPVPKSKDAPAVRMECIRKTQLTLEQVQGPMYVYWAICSDPEEPELKTRSTKSRRYMCDEINGVIKQLHAMAKANPSYSKETDWGVRYVVWYSESEIRKAKFLTTIRELLRYTQSKLIRTEAGLRNAEGDVVRTLIADAWCNAVHGNKFPTTNEQYMESRRKCFSRAIADFNDVEAPLMSLLSGGGYSNDEMEKWMSLLNESERLLLAVQASDRKL